jgi:hypothetical protein
MTILVAYLVGLLFSMRRVSSWVAWKISDGYGQRQPDGHDKNAEE